MAKYRKKTRTGSRLPVPDTRAGRRALLRESLFAMSIASGLAELRQILDEEAEAIAGPKGKKIPNRTANHWGFDDGEVALGGRKVAFRRPRVRTKTNKEVPLPAYTEASGDELLTAATIERIPAGVSTRGYVRTLDPIPHVEERSVSRSAVSRRIVRATRRKLEELQGRDLSDLRLAALVIDGIKFGDHMVVVALGIDQEGRKHVLGLREGATENTTVATALLTNLRERGLDLSAGCLFVIDGAKALRKAPREVYGVSDDPKKTTVQRCTVHKLRNVLDHLPKEDRGRFWARIPVGTLGVSSTTFFL